MQKQSEKLKAMLLYKNRITYVIFHIDKNMFESDGKGRSSVESLEA